MAHSFFVDLWRFLLTFAKSRKRGVFLHFFGVISIDTPLLGWYHINNRQGVRHAFCRASVACAPK